MVTSFADGSKISFEQAIVANATGFKVRDARDVARRSTYDGSIMDIHTLYDIDELRELGGIVDYTVGPAGVKVFCLAEHADPEAAALPRTCTRWARVRSTRSGSRTTCVHFEAPNSIARVVLFGDDAGAAARRPGGRGVRGRQARPEGRARCSTSTACT